MAFEPPRWMEQAPAAGPPPYPTENAPRGCRLELWRLYILDGNRRGQLSEARMFRLNPTPHPIYVITTPYIKLSQHPILPIPAKPLPFLPSERPDPPPPPSLKLKCPSGSPRPFRAKTRNKAPSAKINIEKEKNAKRTLGAETGREILTKIPKTAKRAPKKTQN